MPTNREIEAARAAGFVPKKDASRHSITSGVDKFLFQIGMNAVAAAKKKAKKPLSRKEELGIHETAVARKRAQLK